MYCAQCGQPVAHGAQFCGACGAKVYSDDQPGQTAGGSAKQPAQPAPATNTESAPRVLLRIGPMGIGITSKRPALFTVTQQNNTEVVADTRYLWGIGKMPKFALGAGGKRRGQVVFQIPYDRIIEVTRADFMANKALWIRYQADSGEKGVGITAGMMHHQQLLNLEKLLQQQLAARVSG